MPRIYRYLIVAAVGWLSLAAASPPKQKSPAPDKTDSAAQIHEASRAIVSAIRDTDKPAEHDGGCEKGDEKRESDLCAQWKAADAAADAATYAFWGLIGTAIGTGLLVWTLAETRANSRRELRAYLSVRTSATHITVLPGKGFQFESEAIVHNGGSTPGYACVSFANVIAAPPEAAEGYLRKALPIEKSSLNGGSVVHSGEDLPTEFNREMIIAMNEIDDVLNGTRWLFLYGVTSYLDTFGVRRRTDFCFSLPPERFRDAHLRAQNSPGDPIEVKWKLANFHNTAT